MILLILKYLCTALSEAHMAPCRVPSMDCGELFRVDAKAEGNQVAIGGWLTQGGCPRPECTMVLTRTHEAERTLGLPPG